jgi:hypothetical protein
MLWSICVSWKSVWGRLTLFFRTQITLHLYVCCKNWCHSDSKEHNGTVHGPPPVRYCTVCALMPYSDHWPPQVKIWPKAPQQQEFSIPVLPVGKLVCDTYWWATVAGRSMFPSPTQKTNPSCLSWTDPQFHSCRAVARSLYDWAIQVYCSYFQYSSNVSNKLLHKSPPAEVTFRLPPQCAWPHSFTHRTALRICNMCTAADETYVGHYGVIAGWGRTGNGTVVPGVLLSATVQILDNADCYQLWNPYLHHILDSQVCTVVGNAATCQVRRHRSSMVILVLCPVL